MDNELIQDKISQGVMLMTEERYQPAKELFENIIRDNPRNLEAYIHLSNADVNLELYDDALEALKKALIIDDSYGEAYFSMGSIYVLKEDNLKAIEYFNRAEEKGYASSQMYQIMASIFLEADDEPQALRNIGRAINLEPLDGSLRLFKAKIYLVYNKYEQALETLDEMERILPDAFDVYDIKSQIYLGQEKYKDALDIAEKGCERFPNDCNLALVKLKVLVASDKNDEALVWVDQMKQNGAYEKVLKDAAIQEATLLIKTEKTTEALELLINTNEKLKNDPDLLYLIVDLLGTTGKNEQLLQYSDKLAKEEYGQFYYSTALFFHATALDALERKDEAQKEFKVITSKMRRATIDDPSFYEGYLYRLLAHVKLKEFDKALELAEYAENLYPERADAHAFRYYINKEMGNVEEAEKEKDIAKSMNPNLNIV